MHLIKSVRSTSLNKFKATSVVNLKWVAIQCTTEGVKAIFID